MHVPFEVIIKGKSLVAMEIQLAYSMVFWFSVFTNGFHLSVAGWCTVMIARWYTSFRTSVQVIYHKHQCRACALKHTGWGKSVLVVGAISVGSGCGFGDNWIMYPHVCKLSQGVGKISPCHAGSVWVNCMPSVLIWCILCPGWPPCWNIVLGGRGSDPPGFTICMQKLKL